MNRLAAEKSPYLLQHKHNPVHWWPWGAEAIETAQRQDKPIFLSVGYSTCYWCHVMERECFEDEQVASYLNEHFVSIKVDREERPDIDSVYMEAVVALMGQGGWPLSVFLNTDLKPFFGGTYFPKENFLELLQKIVETWQQKREQVLLASAQLYDVLQVTTRSTRKHDITAEQWEEAYENIRSSFDAESGGFGPAPKFPASGILRFLLRYYRRFNEEEALHMARSTLDAMARGGLFDHLGGGFHRYATDAQWRIPHFEKMLYDNALLVPAYLECWQLSGEDFCREVAQATLDYVLREMRSEQGGFFSAQDAGEVGREGEFYLWGEAEIEDLLSGEEFANLKAVFDTRAAGNFESGLNILYLNADCEWQARFANSTKGSCERLLEVRSARRYPHLDDKVLTAWNGLMISALCKGYQVLQTERYLGAAQQAADFLQSHLYRNGRLYRRFRDEQIQFEAYLEDYAFLVQALLDLYQTDSDERWLSWARELQAAVDQLFWDTEEGGYFAVSDQDPTVLVRRKEHSDDALPSAAAVSAQNLFRLHYLTQEEDYRSRALDAIAAYSGFMQQYPSVFAYTFLALEFEHFGPLEVIISAAPESSLAKETKRQVFEQFQPTLVLACGRPETASGLLAGREENAVFICADGTCSPALTSAEEALRELRERFQ